MLINKGETMTYKEYLDKMSKSVDKWTVVISNDGYEFVMLPTGQLTDGDITTTLEELIYCCELENCYNEIEINRW